MKTLALLSILALGSFTLARADDAPKSDNPAKADAAESCPACQAAGMKKASAKTETKADKTGKKAHRRLAKAKEGSPSVKVEPQSTDTAAAKQ